LGVWTRYLEILRDVVAEILLIIEIYGVVRRISAMSIDEAQTEGTH